MKGIAPVLVLLLLLPAVPVAGDAPPPEMVEVILGLESTGPIIDLLDRLDGRVLDTYSIIPALLVSMPKDALPALGLGEGVRYIQPNQELRALEQSVPWGVMRIDAPSVWEVGSGEGVRVAILDTGIGPHEDLAVAGGVSFLEDASHYDHDGHGTHVAGIVAAHDNEIGVVGVSHGAILYSVRVLDEMGKGTTHSLIKGLEWSVENGMNIVSMSLAADSHSEAMEEAVKAAYEAGILCVAAAGNEGKPLLGGSTVTFPARYESVIAVGAVDEWDVRAFFSSTGPEIELVGPGVDIPSTYLDDGYVLKSGTSMAAPHVTGVAALLWSIAPNLTNIEVRDILTSTAEDLGDPGRDQEYGYGLVNALEAVRAVGENVTVELIEPQEGHFVEGSIMVRAQAFSPWGVERVEYHVDDGVPTQMTYHAPSGTWEAEWDSLGVEDGRHIMTVSALDSLGRSGTDSVTLTVTNHMPALRISIDLDGSLYAVGQEVIVTVMVSDGVQPVQGAWVEVSLEGPSETILLHQGETDASGEVSLAIILPEEGIYLLTVSVAKEGYIDGSSTSRVEVLPPPTIITPAIATARVSQHYSYNASSDRSATWTVETNADFLSLRTENTTWGELSGMPEETGSFWVNITVADPLGTGHQNYTLVVGDAWAPSFLSSPGGHAYLGYDYSYRAKVNETSIWSLDTDAPFLDHEHGDEWLRVFGSPSVGDGGRYYVNITAVSEGGGLPSYQNFTLEVHRTVLERIPFEVMVLASGLVVLLVLALLIRNRRG